MNDTTTTIETLRTRLQHFVEARDWTRFHTPRDLAMAVSVESGELLELFLWVEPLQDGSRPFPPRARLEAEVADVAITLMNLCNRLDIDLASAVEAKLKHNAEKYPIEKARGSALKYDALNAREEERRDES